MMRSTPSQKPGIDHSTTMMTFIARSNGPSLCTAANRPSGIAMAYSTTMATPVSISV